MKYIFIALMLLVPTYSYGYLDAGTGSYFIQVVIGFIVAGLFSLKLFWKRFVLFFHNVKKKNPPL